uniref:amylo-alpha-1,6-glucosidase n=1 Tax=Candidatus Limisoma sp. TaxID=3076476 RepID=UPI003FEFBEB5
VIVNGSLIEAGANSGGFVLAFGEDAESARLLSDAQKQWNDWILDRKDRMQKLVNSNSLMTNNDDLDKSMAWMMLTADELVTRQHGGWGIYAGFPWFTDFWGRDMFIAMPGTVLCPGQFDVAKNILLSFAKYQDLDKKSPTYGRVPNRLNLEGILYNTTDGTPRFVMQVLDYLKYTGDVAFLRSIYNNVKVATDAALDLYVDDRGYLTHADADTWMDAKRQGKYPCSPRGNRAVDIQALWFCQLESAAKIADCLGKKSDADRWRKAAEKLKGNFQKDFVVDGQLVDHLNADGTADRQLRPNTMFAYSLIDSDSVKREDIRKIWSRLTYPWGVSSLDQMDNQFHPYHEQWHRYHKDDAYHNGTVWLWLNGMAMQRMIEFGQEDEAYKLLENMNRQALKDGAVGSLSECADAWCRPGQVWSRRSGTFLQSWSNSEQLRVWSQYFLGVRPNLLDGVLVVAPRIPSELNNVETTVAIGCGRLEYVFKRYDGKQYLSLTLSGQKSVDLSCELKEYDAVSLTLGQGKTIEIEWDSSLLTITDGVKRLSLQPNPEESMRVASNNEYFDGVDFAMPCYREDLNTMSRYFNPPLDYYSVE